MNSIRRTQVIVTGVIALVTAAATFAGTSGEVRDQALKERAERQAQQAPRAQPERGPRPPQAQGGGNRGGPQGGYRPQPGQPQLNAQRDRNGGAVRGYNNHGGNYANGGTPPRVVQTLPRGYRNYNWNGRPYYNYGGSWYRPYGGSYISIGVPYGLFVSTLPGYSSSFWYGNSRYYYYDDTYYMYEPARRGYVVTRSPYNDDPVDSTDQQPADDDLYIYPAKGQSDQQQSDDRYECHRWAADETHYDPVEDVSQSDSRPAYLRAMTACLTGRGYSVK